MSLLSKKAVVLLVAALAGFGAFHAQAAKKNAGTEKVSMLDGKFTFVLPKGFVADPLPTSPSGTTGTMYTNEATKTVVITAENKIPEGQHVKDNDGQFLDGLALSGMVPAPLVIFVTFTGYVVGGLPGALAMTAGMFLPAFAFSMIAWMPRPLISSA